MTVYTQFNRFESSLHDVENLTEEYSLFLERILSAAKWPKSKDYHVRIPWWMAKEARKQFIVSFKSPGLYLFGAETIPRYIGIAKNGSLWSRLRKRYILRPRTQCELAQRYSSLLIEQGIAGFPPDLIDWCKKTYDTLVRLEGAVDFARNGIEEVWFSLIPASNTQNVRSVEKALIPIANRWNNSRSLPTLLNKQHTSDES